MAIKFNLELEMEMAVFDLDTEGEAEAACKKLNALAGTHASHKEHRVLIQSSRKELVAALASEEKWNLKWLVGLPKR